MKKLTPKLHTYSIYFEDNVVIKQTGYNINDATNDAIEIVKSLQGNTKVIKSIQQ